MTDVSLRRARKVRKETEIFGGAVLFGAVRYKVLETAAHFSFPYHFTIPNSELPEDCFE